MRRAALSIPCNIAEGYGRKTTPDYLRFLYMSYGSTCELETQILIAGDLDYLEKTDHVELKSDIAEVERMLKALIKSIERKQSKASSCLLTFLGSLFLTLTLEPSNP